MFVVLRAQTASQETSSEIIFYHGLFPRIHLKIIILHAKLVTEIRPNGSFKEVYSTNGNPLAPYCGYTENVRYSWLSTCDGP